MHRSTIAAGAGLFGGGLGGAGEGRQRAGYPLTLTTAGRRVLAAAAGHDLARLGERMADCTSREIADFARSLQRLHRPDQTIGDDHA